MTSPAVRVFSRHELRLPPPRVSPYDYWRAEWIRTGDLEALRQMIRFVDEVAG